MRKCEITLDRWHQAADHARAILDKGSALSSRDNVTAIMAASYVETYSECFYAGMHGYAERFFETTRLPCTNDNLMTWIARAAMAHAEADLELADENFAERAAIGLENMEACGFPDQAKGGFNCPKCGNARGFKASSVVLTGTTYIGLDGWDYSSAANDVDLAEGCELTCCECGHVGPAADFQ